MPRRAPKRRALIRGSNSEDQRDRSLAPVPPSTEKRLLITGLRKGVSASQMFERIKAKGEVPKRVDRLRTRTDTYSSFCVTVDPAGFKALAAPEIWGTDVAFREFVGTPETSLEFHEVTQAPLRKTPDCIERD